MPPLPPRDKVLHALAGAGLFAAGHLIAGRASGALLCLCGGAAKELADRASGRGTPSTADLLATLAGGALAALMLASPRRC